MKNQVRIDCFVGLFVGRKEVSVKEYERAPVEWNFDASNFRLYNDTTWFPMAKGSWGPITHFALFHTRTGKRRYTKIIKLIKPAPHAKGGKNYCFPRSELIIKFECVES